METERVGYSQKVGNVFAEFLSQRGGVGRINSSTTPNRSNGKEQPMLDATHQLPAPSVPPAEPASPAAPPSGATVSDKDRILKLFSANGEQLELTDTRLKAKSGRNYQRRLTYLTLYGHELHGRVALARSELTTVLKNAKVLDSNARTWLAKKVGFTVDGDDRLKLNTPGREEAVTFLNEIGDPNVADEWNPDTKPVKAKAKKA